ncbi:hypothetical protein F2Q70_00021804 [Brassica cretica]|uniref:Endoplasmic reticulum transmembrane protein n=2 Tax=Brassica cretica TaxID=69181 RepID=A0A3N6SH92_BRACR|nr:hypothetical protein F2Q70_00021804 [Brassica cretica]KAF2555186.1 hypothetical protein F2Q68_00015525 [Brassica cretica]KAF3606471.1 hypothetical protein DY000_02048134 [Brassica cretica]
MSIGSLAPLMYALLQCVIAMRNLLHNLLVILSNVRHYLSQNLYLPGQATSSGYIYKAQRNVVLFAAGILLYWYIYRICKDLLEAAVETEGRYHLLNLKKTENSLQTK